MEADKKFHVRIAEIIVRQARRESILPPTWSGSRRDKIILTLGFVVGAGIVVDPIKTAVALAATTVTLRLAREGIRALDRRFGRSI